MVAGCANKCIKYTFFVFNFMFFVLGGVVCGVALWIRFDNEIQKRIGDLLLEAQMSSIQIDGLYLTLYIIAGLGLVLFLFGFFGCCGACCEQLCAIGVYFVAIGALLLVEIAGAIYLLVNKDNFKTSFFRAFKEELVDNYYLNTVIRNQLDALQLQAGCCGATGCEDYQNTGIPASCHCSPNSEVGCATKIASLFENNFAIIIVICIVIVIVEILALVCSCIICFAVKEQRNVNY